MAKLKAELDESSSSLKTTFEAMGLLEEKVHQVSFEADNTNDRVVALEVEKRSELFDKRFLQRLNKNEILSIITEGAIKETKQSKQLKLFAEKQSVEISFITTKTKIKSNSL